MVERAAQQVGQFRLPAGANEIIDRSGLLSFTFNGHTLLAYPGDTIASALAAHGVRVVARSFKYHRPRGLMGNGHSMNAMVQIDNEVSESAWLRPVADGLVVNPVNVWPSLDRDMMSLAQMGDRFLPVGFYYKTFIRPAALWPTYEKVLRQAAGLGTLDIDAPLEKGFRKRYLHGDIVVVGAGPAGLQAALTAAEGGASVLLFDENPFLGGHLAYAAHDRDQLNNLRDAVHANKQIHQFTNTLIAGFFKPQWLFGVQGPFLYKIRARATILAIGAEDQPLIFDNNDLPGVMMGSAVRRLLHCYGVTAGRQLVIATANRDGWELARELRAAGVEVAAVADMRSEASEDATGFKAYWGATVCQASGWGAVDGAVIGHLNEAGEIIPGSHLTISCDCIALSTHWAPRFDLPAMAGASFAYDEQRCEFIPQASPAGIYLAGRLTGAHQTRDEIDDGRLAAREALAYLGLGSPPSPQARAGITRRKNNTERRSTNLVRIIGDPNGKRFVDLDEDVTDKDVADAIAEGYSSIELLKRYSTISMGPSQGKWSSLNAMHLAAAANGQSIAETGRTTSRPPVRPVKMGHLAGQIMEPVRLTPIHDWHVRQGARIMVAGLWLRPEHYGDPYEEVLAVRERVGLIDISTLGKIKLTGPGVPALLDRLYINRFANLKVGRVRYGVMCNAEGVILDDGVTARVGEQEWYMTTTSSGAASIYEWIQWWVQSGWGDGVHVTSVSEGRAAFNLAGPEARLLLSSLTAADLSPEAFPYMSVRSVKLAGVPCRLLRIGFTGELSYEIHVPASRALGLWEALLEAGRPLGISPFGVEAQRVLRLEKGHFIIGQDTDALTDPLSADLGWAAKLDKEDFLGQRSLSRIAENGIRQRLVGFKMADRSTIPEEGLQIVTPVEKSERHPLGLKIIGWVTSSRFSPTLGEPIGLCWLPVEAAARPDASFMIRRRGRLVEGRVFHGPFFDPDGSRVKG